MDAALSIAIAFLIYFAPAVTACLREHHNALAVFILNLFLGWTLLGWVLALVWACTAVRKPVAGR